MKELIRKEVTLTAAPITYAFIAFSFMTMIPGYPIVVSGFFICLGVLYTYQFAREFNDILYTSLLPVSKDDIVRSKFAFTVGIEMVSFVVMVVLTVIRMTLLPDVGPYVNNPLLNANLAYLGYILMVFALFNTIFLGGFFKTAYYYGKPFVLFCIAAFVVVGISETLPHLPGLRALGATTAEPLQAAVLVLGVAFFVVGTWLSLKVSMKRFDHIDL
jgi:hypothetical protein